MARTRMYQVRNNRFDFKCQQCGAKRSYAVSPSMRRKKVICHNCGETCHCQLNRRVEKRNAQAGRASLLTTDGREFDIDLRDISPRGVGFSVPLNLARMLSARQVVEFRCLWNPNLFSKGRYRIVNIFGQRIGAASLKAAA